MNIMKYYNGLPEYDDLLNIWMEHSDPRTVFPDFSLCDEDCICIYGISESDVADFLTEVKEYSSQLTVTIQQSVLPDEAWDVEIKPVFLFDTKETGLIFIDYVNSLSIEQFYNMIRELQLVYNVPWTMTYPLDNEMVYRIMDRYEEENGND